MIGCQSNLPAIIATVNGEPIYLQALAHTPADARRAKLDALIDDKLLLAQAALEKIRLPDPEITKIKAEALAAYPAGTLNQLLQERGMTQREWLESLVNRQVIERLIRKKFGDAAAPSEQEIQTYYNKHPEDFRQGEEVRVRHILTDTREAAQTILEELKQGENFALIAEKKSLAPERARGGDLGFFGKGTYPPVFETTCFALKIGQISDIVASEYGFHIFKLIDRHPAHMIPMAEAQETIRVLLASRRFKELTDDWVEKLKGSAKIDIREKALKNLNP